LCVYISIMQQIYKITVIHFFNKHTYTHTYIYNYKTETISQYKYHVYIGSLKLVWLIENESQQQQNVRLAVKLYLYNTARVVSRPFLYKTKLSTNLLWRNYHGDETNDEKKENATTAACARRTNSTKQTVYNTNQYITTAKI